MPDKEGSLLTSWVPRASPSPTPVRYLHAGVPSPVWREQQLVVGTAPDPLPVLSWSRLRGSLEISLLLWRPGLWTSPLPSFTSS